MKIQQAKADLGSMIIEANGDEESLNALRLALLEATAKVEALQYHLSKQKQILAGK